VRRLVIAPLVALAVVVTLVALPLVLPVLAIASVLPFRWRIPRILWMVLLYLMLETAALVTLFGLWAGSGFGRTIKSPRFQLAHYTLVRWFLDVLFRECQRVLHVSVKVEGPAPASYHSRPLLILSRHAGPGDSFLLVHALMNWYAREPRIVLKDTLQWDPAIDILLNRLPNRFIAPGRPGTSTVAEVAALSRGLDDNDAFVIFPEGGNFTVHRRKRAIDRLRAKGFIDEAEKAERLRHVMAPKPGGVLAALAEASDADVVFVAHTGVEHLATVFDVWRELPMDMEIEMRWWLVPAADVPDGEAARIDWLYNWWARIDDWVDERRLTRLGDSAGA
jgi:1-acyl-sn-glycerol-3-phosphate acyltransferase